VFKSLSQLPITLVGMIAHGHGDETFFQYSNEFWPNYPNFKIGLLWFLGALKKELVNESRILFEHEPQNAFIHWSKEVLIIN